MYIPTILGLTYQETTTPEAVFEVWRQNEAHDPGWQQCARDHGYDSWESWRMNRFTQLGGENPTWWRFNIHEPLITVPGFFGGPSKTWIKLHYRKPALVRFSEFAHPKAFHENEKIMSLLHAFPKETEVTGLVTDTNDIVIIEGTHRCTALAIAGTIGIEIDTKITISLTSWKENDFPVPDPAPAGPKRVPLDK